MFWTPFNCAWFMLCFRRWNFLVAPWKRHWTSALIRPLLSESKGALCMCWSKCRKPIIRAEPCDKALYTLHWKPSVPPFLCPSCWTFVSTSEYHWLCSFIAIAEVGGSHHADAPQPFLHLVLWRQLIHRSTANLLGFSTFQPCRSAGCPHLRPSPLRTWPRPIEEQVWNRRCPSSCM